MNRTPLLLAVLAAAVLAPASAAVAVPRVEGEFDLRGTPDRLTLGPDGNVWVTLRDAGDDVAKVDPDGRVTGYDVPDLAGSGGITTGPDNRLWVTQPGHVASFSPSDPSRASRFEATGASARTIVTGPDRRLWTVGGDSVLQIDPLTERVERFPVDGMSNANGITSGRDGRLYIADTNGGRIIALTTAGVATPIDVGGAPQQVVAGIGTQLAYTNPGIPQEIGLLQPAGDTVRVSVPATDPFGIAFGRDQAYWVANFLSGDLTRLTLTGQTSRLGGFSPGAGPRYLVAGENGTLWVGLERARSIARITGLDVPVDPPVVNPPLPPEGREPPLADPPMIGIVPMPLPFSPLRLGRVDPRTIVAGRAVTYRVAVSGATRARVRVTQEAGGRRVGGRCVAPTRRNRTARACRRTVVKLAISAPVREEAIRVTFGSRLAPGSYRVTFSIANPVATRRDTRTLTVKPRATTRARARGRARAM